MFQKHVAMINNSWQEPQALEIQIFCSGIILKYWQRPHGHQLSRLDLGIICQILLSQDLNPTTLRHHQASPPSSCNRKMSDHQMCGISRESSNTSSRSEPAAKLIIVRVVSSGSSLNYTLEMIYPLRTPGPRHV